MATQATSEVLFPFGNCDQQTITDAATSTVTIHDNYTQLRKTGGFAQAVTGLSLQAHAELRKGAIVQVRIEQGATGRNVTFGSAGSTITAPALTGVANDIDVIELEWDGTAFKATGNWEKVVDAA
jgi:hypothetical protein